MSDFILDDNVELELDHDCIDGVVSGIVEGTRRAKVNLASSFKSSHEWEVWLDTCAEESVFKTGKLFKNFQELEPIYIDGVNGDSSALYTDIGGDTTFGTAYVSDKVRGNILSFGNVADQLHSVAYNKKKDMFEVVPVKDGITYLFKRSNYKNMYVCDIRTSTIHNVQVAVTVTEK